jgi:hypothetical protein
MDDESRDKYKDKLSCLYFLFSPFTSSKTLTYNLYSLQSCRGAHRDIVGNGGGFYHASWWGVVLERFLDLIIKLWLMFRSRHLILLSLGTYGLQESG